MNTVRMYHPDLPDQEFDSPEAGVPQHRAAGWIPVGEKLAEPPADTESGDGQDGQAGQDGDSGEDGDPAVNQPVVDDQDKAAAKPPKSTSTRARAAEKE